MPMSLVDSGFQVQLVRPLLGVRKAQLEQFCRDEGLHWVEDPTNQDTSFMRNLLRQRLAQSSAAARLPVSVPGEGASGMHSAMASLPVNRVQAVDDSAKRRHAQCSQSDADLLLSHGDEAVIDGEAAASSVVLDILRLSSACRDGHEKLEQRTAALISAATNHDRDSDTSVSESGKTSGSQQHKSVGSVDQPTFVNLRPFRGAKRHIGIRALVQLLQVQPVVILTVGRWLSLSRVCASTLTATMHCLSIASSLWEEAFGSCRLSLARDTRPEQPQLLGCGRGSRVEACKLWQAE